MALSAPKLSLLTCEKKGTKQKLKETAHSLEVLLISTYYLSGSLPFWQFGFLFLELRQMASRKALGRLECTHYYLPPLIQTLTDLCYSRQVSICILGSSSIK